MTTKLNPPPFLKAVALCRTVAATAGSARAQATSTERIGIYDSRAVAVAYAESSFQQAKMNELVSQQKKAKSAGDKKEIAHLEAAGCAWQAQLHRQGFGIAPVDDLLAYIPDGLSRIQTGAGVTQLISKWDQPALKKLANARQIDLTTRVMDTFHPSELQRQRAIEIQRNNPSKLKR